MHIQMVRLCLTELCRTRGTWSTSVWTAFPFLTASYVEADTSHITAASLWVSLHPAFKLSSVVFFMNLLRLSSDCLVSHPYHLLPESGQRPARCSLHFYRWHGELTESSLNWEVKPFPHLRRYLGDTARSHLHGRVRKQHCQELQQLQCQISEVKKIYSIVYSHLIQDLEGVGLLVLGLSYQPSINRWMTEYKQRKIYYKAADKNKHNKSVKNLKISESKKDIFQIDLHIYLMTEGFIGTFVSLFYLFIHNYGSCGLQ